MTTRTNGTVAAFVMFAICSTAAGQTITVTTAADVVDVDWQTATIADLPGPDGEVSFSEAMIAANHTPGHDIVGFAIPQDEWILQFIHPGAAVITALTGYFFHADEEITIDGTTQTEFTGDTNPDGWEVVIYGTDLGLNADNCTLIGFDSTSVGVSGSFGLIEGNTGSMNIPCGGSGNLIKDNLGGTIMVAGTNNVIVGNTVQRVRVLGGSGNQIGGPNPADRNNITGYGYVNSEGMPGGATVQISGTSGTVIENNWIGLATDGVSQGSLASTQGITFQGENHDTLIVNNRIAGILGHGQGPHHAGQLFGWAILVGGSGSGLTIVGNKIGLDANDEPLLGSVWGIDVGNVITSPSTISDITIGGTSPGEGNIIAGHILNGITVGHDVPQVRISGNSIFANQWLSIDLIPTGYGYGATPNDPLDADDGGNGLQNSPEIESATYQGPDLEVVGSLHSSPMDDFTVEFFVSPECDDAGFGGDMIFLGFADVFTDASGNGSFDVLLPAEVPQGWMITSTATLEPIGATSEFSSCVEIAFETTFCGGDEDCDDGVFCNGQESCLEGICLSGSNPCGQSCNESTDSCDNDPVPQDRREKAVRESPLRASLRSQ